MIQPARSPIGGGRRPRSSAAGGALLMFRLCAHEEGLDPNEVYWHVSTPDQVAEVVLRWLEETEKHFLEGEGIQEPKGILNAEG